MATQFEGIYLDQSRHPGILRITSSGLGWKVADKAGGGSASVKTSEPFLLPASEIQVAFWSRGARGYEARIQTRTKGLFQLDGFDQDELTTLKNSLKNNIDVNLEVREHSLRGWNWGQGDFERSELVFNVAHRPAFELSYKDITNSNVVGKTEVAVEFGLPAATERTKAGDELVEMRFYIPGTTVKDEEDKDEDVKEESDEEAEDQSAAQIFCDTLKDKADIGAVAGEAIVTFGEVLFLTPRGRYDIDMYASSFRLRGKTYDYKVAYQNVQRMFLLPKPDGIHNMLIIQLDPPLRQGQTSYPFLIMQFPRDDEIEVELNLEDEEYNEKYASRLKRTYDEAAHQVVAQLFKGLTEKRVIFPSSFTSTQGEAAVSCSLKASEGYLYLLEKCFVFLTKPTLYIPFSEVSHITFSRVSGGVSSSRTFDVTIHVGSSQHPFSNIDREEQKGIEAFIKSKGIKIKNEIADSERVVAAMLGSDSESDEEMAADRGSADDDSESPDEDFEMDEESDVAEEFDENASSDSDEGESDGSPAGKRLKVGK